MVLKKLISLLRMTHWSKAIFVLLGVIYADNPSYWPKALLAAFAFCLIASAVYIYNDIHDREEDRLHPQKSQRPLASEEISPVFAIHVLIFLLIGGLGLAFLVSSELALILALYLLINLLYNHGLRNLPIMDVVCIAFGFMLRILAGTVGIGLPVTWWLMLAATFVSLLIALSKRQLEFNLALPHLTRAVLRKYHPRMLRVLINTTAMACFLTYLFYTIYSRDQLFYFLLTLTFAAFVLGRFAWLTTKPSSSDDPIAVFFSDKLSCLNLICFFILTLMALYGGSP
jgi:4-hydroxybenzoate polyprenyltransferase